MAYDALKNTIRQYIKTNGEQEITGQILQDILIAMVNEYPSLDGYATQSWVNSTLTNTLAGYATQSWVNSTLASYLPLTGGTLTGNLYMAEGTNIRMTVAEGARRGVYLKLGMHTEDSTDYCLSLQYSPSLTPVVAGIDIDGNIYGVHFIVNGGTSSQFLKADGSVDSNTYLTSASLAGYLPLTGGTLTGPLMTGGTTVGIRLRAYIDDTAIAIQQYDSTEDRWVSKCKLSGPGYIDGSTYHGDQYIVNNGTSSDFLKADGSLDSTSYLPLTGGTVSGSIRLGGSLNFGASTDGRISADASGILSILNDIQSIVIGSAGNNYYVEFIEDIRGGTGTASGVTTQSWSIGASGAATFASIAKTGGTSSQFLKADGSVDSNTYVSSSALSNYLPLSAGSTYKLTNTLYSECTGSVTQVANIKSASTKIAYLSLYTSGEKNVDVGFMSGSEWGVPDTGGAYLWAAGNSNVGGLYVSGSGLYYTDSGGDFDKYLVYHTGNLSPLTTSNYSNYCLPLSGGTLTGNLSFSNINNDGYLGGVSYSWGGVNDLFTIWSAESSSAAVCITSPHIPFLANGSKGWTGSTVGARIRMQDAGGNDWWDNGVDSNSYYYIKHSSYSNKLLMTNSYNYWGGSTGLDVWLASSTVIGIDGYRKVVIGQLLGMAVVGAHNSALNAWDVITIAGSQINFNIEGTSTPSAYFDSSKNFVCNGNITVNPSGNKTLRFGTDGWSYITRRSDAMIIAYEQSGDLILGNKDNQNYTLICNDFGGGAADSNYDLISMDWKITTDGRATFYSVTQTSDMRYKNVMGDVKMSIYNVANAPLFKFTWKDEQKYTGQHIGSAAQYWQTVLPELVSLGSEKMPRMGMQYDVIALASAITIAKKVVNHEERITILERENKALRDEIARLTAA